MAQPLIKFYRVAKIADLQATQKVQGGLYFETETGILYVYNGTAFEAYSGLKSASFADQKLVLTPSVGDAIEIDLSGYVDSNEFNTELANYVKKEQTIAGIDLHDNITVEDLKTALGLTDENLSGEANVLEGVKVNGEALTIDAEKTVNILVAEGSTNGTIAVNNKDVAVHGLDSAAYKSEDYFVKYEGYVAYSEPEKTKLAGIEAGAEVNIIETVKVNGVALTPDADRAVDVLIPDAAVKGVKSGDKVLALDSTDGMLSTTVSMEYKSTSEGGDGYIYLKGIDGAELSKINAAEFVKDGMIDSIVMEENNVLTITWNTASGKTEATTIDFSKYIDTFTHYGARKGVKIVEDGDTAYYEGVVDTASETFLTVGEAGFKLSGVQTAIDTAAAKATTVVVEGTDEGNNLSIVESTAADGHSIYTVNLTDVASAQGLSDLTKVVNDNEQVTAAALNELNGRMVTAEGEIDALQAMDLGVKTVKGQGGEYVTVTPTEASKGDVTVSVSVATTKATNPTYTNDALATDGYVEEQAATAESNAKTYAENLMSWTAF